ncbi:type II secretion system F family protein [Terrabacter sp. AAH1]
MRVDPATVVAALLLLVAVLLWPRSRRHGGVAVRDSVWAEAPRRRGQEGPVTSPSLWHQDPVELFRRWRLRRRNGELADDVLELLRGVGPALDAGLTPSRSIELAASAAFGAERVARARESVERAHQAPERRRARRRGSHPEMSEGDLARLRAGLPTAGGRGRDRRLATAPGVGRREAPASSGPMHDIDRLVGAVLSSADRAEAVSPVWAHWAARSGSAELALVAAAWQLSETTGAPLSFAVDRAVRGLLDARARRRKVAVAVAGPRATVTVLTVLPLTGPLFGLAVGVDPPTLYLGSGAATACLAAGVALVWAGRLWCTHMVRRAVGP